MITSSPEFPITMTEKLVKIKPKGISRRNQYEDYFQHSFLATPAYSAANLFQTSGDNDLCELLSSIPYVDVAVVNVEYNTCKEAKAQ